MPQSNIAPRVYVGMETWARIIQRIAQTNPNFSNRSLPVLFMQLIRYLLEYISMLETGEEPLNSVISNILRATFYILNKVWFLNPIINFNIPLRIDPENADYMLQQWRIVELTRQFSIVGLRLSIIWPEWEGLEREADIQNLGFYFTDLLSILSCRTQKYQYELASALLAQELRLERLATCFAREH